MAKRLRQVFLKPGRYGNTVLTRKQIEDHVRGTKEMIAAGYNPVLFLEHPPKGSEEGAPRSRRQTKIEQLLGAAGWGVDVEIGADGAAAHVLDVTDPKIAEKIQDGSIRFTSPELRPSVKLDGREFKNVFSHIALTHRPRNPQQTALEPALAGPMQFSLDDWEPIQMADDYEKDKPEDEGGEMPSELDTAPEPTPPANPDMPEPSDAGKQAQRVEAILAHLEELGVSLPDDTKEADVDTLLDRLLTGLKTACKARQQAEAETEPEEEAEAPQVVEQSGMQQFSLDDIDDLKDTLGNRRFRKLVAATRGSLETKVDRMVEKNKITLGAKKKLLGIDGVMQFSAEGDFAPTLTLEQVVDVLDDCLIDNACLTEEQIGEQFSLAEHPHGEKHYKSGSDEITPEQAKRANDELLKKQPGLFGASK